MSLLLSYRLYHHHHHADTPVQSIVSTKQKNRRHSSPVFTRLYYLPVVAVFLLFAGKSTTVSAALPGGNNNNDDRFGYCCLCANCNMPVRSRLEMIVSSDTTTTCGEMWLQMAGESVPGSNDCLHKKDLYRQTCCDATFEPLQVVMKEEEDESALYPSGEHPACNLCHNGQYPSRPHTVTAVLQLEGNPTCKDLYYLGKKGNLQEGLCNPIQDYFHEPCGCGQAPTEPTTTTPSVSPTFNHDNSTSLDEESDEQISNTSPPSTSFSLPSNAPSNLPSPLLWSVPSNMPSINDEQDKTPSVLVFPPYTNPSSVLQPSSVPSNLPTEAMPTAHPSLAADHSSYVPSLAPTRNDVDAVEAGISSIPSFMPSIQTDETEKMPSLHPSSALSSLVPSTVPSSSPTSTFSSFPSVVPTSFPSDRQTTGYPSSVPTSMPSHMIQEIVDDEGEERDEDDHDNDEGNIQKEDNVLVDFPPKMDVSLFLNNDDDIDIDAMKQSGGASTYQRGGLGRHLVQTSRDERNGNPSATTRTSGYLRHRH